MICHSFFKKTVQTVVYMPYFLSWVVLGGILPQTKYQHQDNDHAHTGQRYMPCLLPPVGAVDLRSLIQIRIDPQDLSTLFISVSYYLAWRFADYRIF